MEKENKNKLLPRDCFEYGDNFNAFIPENKDIAKLREEAFNKKTDQRPTHR